MSSNNFVMHAVQYASANARKSYILFETRTPSGQSFFFELSRNQFIAFNDVIILIEEGGASNGDYPLGNGFWFHYKYYNEGVIYDAHASDKHPYYFKFTNLKQYLKGAHRQLLSFLSDEGEENGGRSRRRKRYLPSEARKRSLSNKAESAHKFGEYEETTSKWKTPSRSTINADVSYEGEDGAVLSKWNDTNSGRRNNSPTFSADTSDDQSNITEVCLSLDDTFDAVEGDE